VATLNVIVVIVNRFLFLTSIVLCKSMFYKLVQSMFYKWVQSMFYKLYCSESSPCFTNESSPGFTSPVQVLQHAVFSGVLKEWSFPPLTSTNHKVWSQLIEGFDQLTNHRTEIVPTHGQRKFPLKVAILFISFWKFNISF
jgi:hypothetical protein